MPTPLIKAFAKKAHRSKKRIERYWDDAKKAAAKKFDKKDDSYWAYVNAIVQRRAGLREGATFKEFLALEGMDDDNHREQLKKTGEEK